MSQATLFKVVLFNPNEPGQLTLNVVAKDGDAAVVRAKEFSKATQNGSRLTLWSVVSVEGVDVVVVEGVAKP
jgi:hypothetical protein